MVVTVKYRKKPVVIEAVRWNGKYTDATEWPDWFRWAMDSHKISVNKNKTLWIKTLEGAMVAFVGDMVIQGTKGEIYCCKPDIFEATYESV